MGYSVYIERSTAQIKRENFEKIKKAWIDMDKNQHDKKRGYTSASDERWFSWMDSWESAKDGVVSTLEQLGFDVENDETKDYISIVKYNSKIGQENLFFEAIGKYVTGSIIWVGEDDDTWTWKFKDRAKK